MYNKFCRYRHGRMDGNLDEWHFAWRHWARRDCPQAVLWMSSCQYPWFAHANNGSRNPLQPCEHWFSILGPQWSCDNVDCLRTLKGTGWLKQYTDRVLGICIKQNLLSKVMTFIHWTLISANVENMLRAKPTLRNVPVPERFRFARCAMWCRAHFSETLASSLINLLSHLIG